jgi:hypothetical protein
MADVTSPFGFPYPEDTDLVRDGASDIENLAEGVNDYLAGGYLYAGQVRFTSSGTFVKADPLGTGDIGLRAIRVRMIGGGGSGGSLGATGASEAAASNGGGGGGYCEKFITDIAGLSASETVTRGAGGSPAAAGENTGNSGTASTFNGMSAGGGDGGFSGLVRTSFPTLRAPMTSGGTSSGGDLNITGGPGGVGFTLGFGGTSEVIGGGGGDTVLGSGASANFRNGDTANRRSPTVGGGGAGWSAIQNESAKVGGAGANGIVIIDCYV